MTQASEMSMSVSCSGCGVQYAGERGLAGLCAGLRRGGPRYLRMLAEVPRFHRAARRVLEPGESGELSLGRVSCARRGFSAYFATHFAAPLVGPSGRARRTWHCATRRLSVRLPRQPRDAVGFRLAAVAYGQRRFAVLRRGRRGRPGEDLPVVSCRFRPPVPRRGGGARRVRGSARLRRRGDRHPPGSGAADARRRHARGTVSPRRVPLSRQPGSAAH